MIYISSMIIPTIISIILFIGIKEKKSVYDLFINGARDGIKVAFKLFPTLIGIFLAIYMLRSSGLIDFICNILEMIIPVVPHMVHMHIIPTLLKTVENAHYSNKPIMIYTLLRFIQIAPFDVLREFLTPDILSTIALYYDDPQTKRNSSQFASQVILDIIQRPDDAESIILEMVLNSDIPPALEDYIEEAEDLEDDDAEDNFNDILMSFLLKFKNSE